MQKDKLKGNDLAIPELIGQELGGLTGIWFNLLHSKRYKANRHSQPPYSIKNVKKKKKISRAYKSRILKGGELTCIKIEYSVLP